MYIIIAELMVIVCSATVAAAASVRIATEQRIRFDAISALIDHAKADVSRRTGLLIVGCVERGRRR